MTFDIKRVKFDIDVEFVGLSPSTDQKRMTILPSVLPDVTGEEKYDLSEDY